MNVSIRPRRPRPLRLGGEPAVNLLPPEVAQRAKAKRTRQVLSLLVVGSVLIVGAGYGVAFSRSVASQAELVGAQDRTQALLTEQLEYADATRATGLIASAENARELGASTEVLWDDAIDAVKTYLPDGARIASATMSAPAPWETELLPAGPLREARVATVTFVVTSQAQLDATGIIRNLRGLEGFADASPDLVIADDDGFTTTITLNLNSDALSGRFASQETDQTK